MPFVRVCQACGAESRFGSFCAACGALLTPDSKSVSDVPADPVAATPVSRSAGSSSNVPIMLALVGFVAVGAVAALLVLNLQGGNQRYADSLMTVCGRMSDDVGIRDRSVELGMSGAIN